MKTISSLKKVYLFALLFYLFLPQFIMAQTTVTVLAPIGLCSRTYTYKVCQQSGAAISHFDLALPVCITNSHIERVYLNGVVFNDWEIVVDPSCAQRRVLKWDNIQVNNGSCKEFKVVFKTPTIVTNVDWWSKYGGTCQMGGPVKGPSCITCSESTLASQLISFDAKREATGIVLRWAAIDDLNGGDFAVERNSGNDWQQIGWVENKSQNAGTVTHYSFNAPDVTAISTQYRLRIQSNNSPVSYSEVETIEAVIKNKVTIFPNPSVDGTVTVAFPASNSSRNIIIYNHIGQTINQWTNHLSDRLTVKLKPGIYTIKVFSSNSVEFISEKLIVQ